MQSVFGKEQGLSNASLPYKGWSDTKVDKVIESLV